MHITQTAMIIYLKRLFEDETILVPSTVPDTQNMLNKFSSITDITANSTVRSFLTIKRSFSR